MEENCCKAFAALVDRYYRQVFSICYRRLNNRADAEDATQDVFRKLIESSDEIERDLGGWLRSCAVNTSISMIRSSSARRRRENACDNEECCAESTEHIDRVELVNRMLSELDDQQRELLIRHVVGGVSQSALAQELGVTQQAVASRITTIRNRLRGWLDLRQITLGLGFLVTGWWSTAKAAVIRTATSLGLPTTGGGVGVVGASAGKGTIATAVAVSVICLLPGDDPQVLTQQHNRPDRNTQARATTYSPADSQTRNAANSSATIDPNLLLVNDNTSSSAGRSLSSLMANAADVSLYPRTVTDPLQYNNTQVSEPLVNAASTSPVAAATPVMTVPAAQPFTSNNSTSLAIATPNRVTRDSDLSADTTETRELSSVAITPTTPSTAEQPEADMPVEVVDAEEDIPAVGGGAHKVVVVAKVNPHYGGGHAMTWQMNPDHAFVIDKIQQWADARWDRTQATQQWQPTIPTEHVDDVSALAGTVDFNEPNEPAEHTEPSNDAEYADADAPFDFKPFKRPPRDMRWEEDRPIFADGFPEPGPFDDFDPQHAMTPPDFEPLTQFDGEYHPFEQSTTFAAILPNGDKPAEPDAVIGEVWMPIMPVPDVIAIINATAEHDNVPDVSAGDVSDGWGDSEDLTDIDLAAVIIPVATTFSFTYQPVIVPMSFAADSERLALNQTPATPLPEPAGILLLGLGSTLLLRRS